MREGVDGELALAYLDEDRRQRVLHSKIGCVLALVLMPAGVSLDYFVYPEHVWALLGSRLLCDVAVLAVLGLLFTRFGERNIRVLGIAWALLPCVAIAWMIYYTEGVNSMYYAGLNLVIIAVSLLMPWTMGEVLTTCAITLLFYLAAVTGHAFYLEKELFGDNTRDLFNNVYFLALTATICATASFFLSKLRFQDWRLRHELGQRNEEINDSYKKLAALDRLKSEFFANVSHELRTPLTLILAPIDELLRRGGTGEPKADRLLQTARENGLRLLRLINDMLDLVRLDVKGAELQRRKADLAQLVPGIVHSAGHLAQSKELTLDVKAPGEPLTAEVDSNALEKVVLNILTNAIKFTPAGGRIDVVVSRNGENAVIEVKDTGIGISAENLPRIFERFGQIDGSSTRQYSGVGIGLALSRELVEAHGGTLTAESEPGRGTTMRAEFPLHGGDEYGERDHTDSSDSIAMLHTAARRSLTLTTEKADAEPIGSGDDVLVVEDEPEMRRFIVSLLSDNYRVHQAADGNAGLEAALRIKPRVALLDVMMPGIDGLELCRRLRAEPSLAELKVVILTARSDEESKITALEHGAHDFLVKPFSTLELRTRVANLLKSAELEQRLRRTNEELRSTLTTLRETEDQLIASEKLNALGTLASGLLHEINNPLNFTLAAVQLAVMTVSEADKDMSETLGDIESGMRRIKDIVTDLKTFAYPDKEKQQRHAVFAVQRAVEAALRIAQHNLLDIDVEVDQPPEVRIQASETQVVQVLINLVTNAARAIEKKRSQLEAERDTSQLSDENAPPPLDYRGHIKVSVVTDGKRVKMCVRDNGTGIPKESISKVFDPFYTTREPGQGMGLGLSICHTIARNHGGRIMVESVLGEWTEVCFDVPADHEELD